jgi:fructose-bisphosphate aldolase class I
VDIKKLAEMAQKIVAPGKGILAADESSGTIKRRFDSIEVASTEENRRAYRELLFRAKGIGDHLSGVILYDETIKQKAADGTPMVKILSEQGLVPGIKVDIGTKTLAGSPSELHTEGLDGLRERLAEYVELGAGFTKWRGVITIGDGIPSQYCIEVNAHALARFAALSQEAGLVPLVEPEVLMDGSHDIEKCFEVTEATLMEVFSQLRRQGVILEGALLKPNMVLSGSLASNRATPDEVAEKTIACFKRTVPSALPGILFLSGGQSDGEATVNLNAINKLAASDGAPWQLTFSYGRGLQAAPLKAWAGKAENTVHAQTAFQHRARVTSAARCGSYRAEMETIA